MKFHRKNWFVNKKLLVILDRHTFESDIFHETFIIIFKQCEYIHFLGNARISSSLSPENNL